MDEIQRFMRAWLSSYKLCRRRKVPVLLQLSNVECGAACLAMILSYYGHQTSVAEIRKQTDLGRDGLTALSIVNIARARAMNVRAVSLPPQDFQVVPLPAIVHWEYHHFVVVEQWSPQHVVIIDPGEGRKKLTHEEFAAGFTGVVIMLKPGGGFVTRAVQRTVTLRSFAWRFIRQSPFILVYLLGISLILQFFGLALPLMTDLVVSSIIPNKQEMLLPVLGGGVLLLMGVQALVLQLRALLLVNLQNRIDLQLMPSFVQQLLCLPLRFFEQRSSGDLLARIFSNTSIRDLVSSYFLGSVLDGGLIVFYLAILTWQSPSFALLTVMLGSFQLLIWLVTRGPRRLNARQVLDSQGEVQGYLSELVRGIATIKVAGAEQRALTHWSELFGKQILLAKRQSMFSASVNTLMSMVGTASMLLPLWLGTVLVLQGHLQMGAMLALSVLTGEILAPLGSLVGSLEQLQVVRAHLERLADVLDAEPEQPVRPETQLTRLSGSVQLRSVGYRYAADAPMVVQDVTLDIRPGQTVALVGRTGSGKSTLGKLLLGLCLPSEGEIFYDGLPIRQLPFQDLRAQFGAVLQEIHLFRGSIRENIAFHDPQIDLDKVMHVAKIIGLHDDIMKMPMKYDTQVAEAGIVLSGGQRQRLVLARALAHDPVILLLDEATSALDVLTEQSIAHALRTLRCTQIIIAHRLSTIRNADLILVMDQGRVVERGNHHELLARNGYYTRLLQTQMEQDARAVAAESSSLLKRFGPH